MFNTVIVAIDGRPQDAEALALARQLAAPGAEIIAANVAVVDSNSALGFDAKLQELTEETVDAFTEGRDGVEGLTTVASGVGEGLRALAVGASADLIVASSSRRGLVGRIFAGDSVRDVLRHSPCPVAIATVGFQVERSLNRIVVGFDGSGAARAALLLAVGLAGRDGAMVDVIQIVEPLPATTPLAGPYAGDAIDESYERAKGDLHRLRDEFGLVGTITVGSPAHELAAASRSADLLAIGLTDHSVLERLLIGSTGHALLREQACPMLIAPPESSAPNHPVIDDLDSVLGSGSRR